MRGEYLLSCPQLSTKPPCMTATVQPRQDPIASASPFEARLLEENGELMDGAALRRLLHMGHDRSFRRALAAGHLPVSVFHLPGRKGWFARTGDVAAWLASLGSEQREPL